MKILLHESVEKLQHPLENVLYIYLSFKCLSNIYFFANQIQAASVNIHNRVTLHVVPCNHEMASYLPVDVRSICIRNTKQSLFTVFMGLKDKKRHYSKWITLPYQAAYALASPTSVPSTKGTRGLEPKSDKEEETKPEEVDDLGAFSATVNQKQHPHFSACYDELQTLSPFDHF